MRGFEKAISKLFDAILNKNILEKMQENETEDKNNDLWFELMNKRMKEKEKKNNE